MCVDVNKAEFSGYSTLILELHSTPKNKNVHNQFYYLLPTGIVNRKKNDLFFSVYDTRYSGGIVPDRVYCDLNSSAFLLIPVASCCGAAGCD